MTLSVADAGVADVVADAGCVARTLPSDDVREQDAAAYGDLTYGDRAYSDQGDDGTTSPRAASGRGRGRHWCHAVLGAC